MDADAVGLHLRPVPAPDRRRPCARHRQAPPARRPHRRGVPRRGTGAGRADRHPGRAAGGAAPRAGDARRHAWVPGAPGDQGLRGRRPRPGAGRRVRRRGRPGRVARPAGRDLRLVARRGRPDGRKVLLAGGLTPDNVADAIERVGRGASTWPPGSRGRRRARPEGPPQGAGLSSPTPGGRRTRRRSPTLDDRPLRLDRGRDSRLRDPCSAMAEPDEQRPLRALRRTVRPRDADPGAGRAGGRVPRRLGRPRLPGRARRAAARLRRPAVARSPSAQRLSELPRPAAPAQAGGPQPHRLAQDQQRARPGPAGRADGQAPGSSPRPGPASTASPPPPRRPCSARSASSTWARSTWSARRSTCSGCGCSAPRSVRR